MIEVLLIYLLLGSIAGVVAGLFGIGGGILIVPVLIFCFELQGFPPEVLTHSAIATSLATIVATSISSTLAHHKHGAVDWYKVRVITIGLLIGALIGVKTAGMMSGEWLQIMLGSFALFVAIQVAFDLKPARGKGNVSAFELTGAGGVIGWLSSILGIGGGTLSVPYLTVRGLQMQRSVATSAACGIPIAVAAAVMNVIEGWANPLMPVWNLGYIYLPALIGIVLTSSIFAKVGARLAHALPAKLLKRIFALFLLSVAVRFLVTNLV